MSSAFFGLDVALRALRAQQTLIDVTNQNVANANTPGYSRQVATVRASEPFPVPAFNALGLAGQLGTGVEVSQIARVRDSFVDLQLRGELTAQGRWDARGNALTQVEAIFNEPSSSGLSALMSKYWQAWQQVANSPSDLAVRSNVVEQGKAVAEGFHRLASQLTTLQRDLDQQASLTVTDVNNYASQIAAINKQIARVELSGMKANDLRDQRDQLLDKLGTLVKITSVESSNGQVSVYLGSRQLVDRDVAHALAAAVPSSSTTGFVDVVWQDGGQPASVLDGKLKGLVEARDQVVQQRLDDLNTLAQRFMGAVNNLHRSGVGLGPSAAEGTDFFTNPTGGAAASSIEVNASILADLSLVAAGRRNADGTIGAGDSRTAVAIAALEHGVTQLATSPASPLSPQASFSATVNGTPTTVTVQGVSTYGALPGSSYDLSVATVAGVPTVQMAKAATPPAPPVNVDVVVNGGTVVLDAAALGVRIYLTTNPPLGASTGADLVNGLVAASRASVTTDATNATVGDQYGSQIAALGVESQSAKAQSTNQQVLVNQLQRQRDSQSGVSLDEETTHLIAYQHAYQAAARVMSVMDEMLDKLINGTGVVGR